MLVLCPSFKTVNTFVIEKQFNIKWTVIEDTTFLVLNYICKYMNLCFLNTEVNAQKIYKNIGLLLLAKIVH